MLSNRTTIILVQQKYVIKQNNNHISSTEKYVIKQNNNHISSTEICYQTEQQSY